MAQPPTINEVRAATGISQPYASVILGKRKPPRSLAIRIYRATGWRHPSIEKLTEEQIALLETVEPWTPPHARERAAA